jgi:Pectinacetylesterase
MPRARSVFLVSITVAALAASASGCRKDKGRNDGLPAVPEPGEWIEVLPGGDTICARGAPFRYFVRGGRADRLIIDFQGGGACWSAATCSVSGAIFRDSPGTLDGFVAAIDAGALGGIFNPGPTAPFADWTIIHIPYCTGDVHWGDADVDYGNNLTIQHRGFVNAAAALDWAYSRYPDPETVLVSGCSAGAYGAILHSAYIARHYGDAIRMAVLADSGAGIMTDDFLVNSLPIWNAKASLPPFIASLQRPLSELALPDLYAGVGAYYPQHRFAQTSTAFDSDQIFYYTAMGGDAADWPQLFRASIAELEAEVPNFRAYVAPGPMHCVTPYPFFETREVEGVTLSDWTAQLVLGETMPDSVACDDDGCCEAPVCDACAAGDHGAWCRFCEGWPAAYSGCAD